MPELADLLPIDIHTGLIQLGDQMFLKLREEPGNFRPFGVFDHSRRYRMKSLGVHVASWFVAQIPPCPKPLNRMDELVIVS